MKSCLMFIIFWVQSSIRFHTFYCSISFGHKSVNINSVKLTLNRAFWHMFSIWALRSFSSQPWIKCVFSHFSYKRGSLHHCTEVVTPWGPRNYENNWPFTPSYTIHNTLASSIHSRNAVAAAFGTETHSAVQAPCHAGENLPVKDMSSH